MFQCNKSAESKTRKARLHIEFQSKIHHLVCANAWRIVLANRKGHDVHAVAQLLLGELRYNTRLDVGLPLCVVPHSVCDIALNGQLTLLKNLISFM